jgi:hypothetical protein
MPVGSGNTGRAGPGAALLHDFATSLRRKCNFNRRPVFIHIAVSNHALTSDMADFDSFRRGQACLSDLRTLVIRAGQSLNRPAALTSMLNNRAMSVIDLICFVRRPETNSVEATSAVRKDVVTKPLKIALIKARPVAGYSDLAA